MDMFMIDRLIIRAIRSEDYYELKKTPALFARKFSQNVDSSIIEKLYEDLLMENETDIIEE